MANPNTEDPVLQIGEELPDGGVTVHVEGGEDAPGGDAEESTARPAGAEHADPELDGDQTLNDPAREAVRQRRREERQNKKAKQREREDNLREELARRDRTIAELGERLVQVEQRGTVADLNQLDSAVSRASQAVSYYKGVIEEATKRQDGGMVADATQRMMAATQEAARLGQIKEQFVARANAGSGGQPALDPLVKRHAEEWASRNSWYKPDASDADSELMLVIDKQVNREGFDPRTKEYWDELDRRKARYLAHRSTSDGQEGYNRAAPQERSAGTPVAGSGREGGAGNGARSGSTFQLSAARVQALKDAGVWDDPKARDEMIRSYQKYDRQQAAARRS